VVRRISMDESAIFSQWEDEVRDDPTYIVHGMLCEITEAICEALQRRGMSQADLARRLGVTPQYISEFLNTPENTTLKQIVRFAQAVGLETEVALREPDDAEEPEPETAATANSGRI
jgi:transcriptional regulator with XRE-family HTH domain